MPKDIGQSKKSSGTRSYSFSGTVWATETEWHRWRMQRDKVQNMTGERLGLLLFRSIYLGNLVREAALMQDKDVDDVIAFIQQNLLEASSGAADPDKVSDNLMAAAIADERRWNETKARDDKLVAALERMGLPRFVEWVHEHDDNFDHIAWLKRVGYAFELSLRDKIYRLLLAYFAEYGDQPKADVIEWATRCGLIGDNDDQTTVGNFIKLGSQLGFSSGAGHGKWGMPAGMVESHIPKINIKEYDGSQILLQLYQSEDVELSK